MLTGSLLNYETSYLCRLYCEKMAGVILENLSTKKLVPICILLMAFSLTCFIIGGKLGMCDKVLQITYWDTPTHLYV